MAKKHTCETNRDTWERLGGYEPCGKPATHTAHDPRRGQEWPVCPDHAREHEADGLKVEEA